MKPVASAAAPNKCGYLLRYSAIFSKEATAAENPAKRLAAPLPGTQQELYLDAILGWTNYNVLQKDFANKVSTSFTNTLGDEQIAFIRATEAKPDKVTRSSFREEARIKLEYSNQTVPGLFRQGISHGAKCCAWVD
jgi:hypothetical protein